MRRACALLLVLAACGSGEDVIVLDAGVPSPEPSVPSRSAPLATRFQWPALQTSLPEYELLIPQAAMDFFSTDVYTPEQPAKFRAGGVSLDALVRLRGASSRTFPKKSWNVDLGDGRFDGRRRFNLIAEYQDATLMVEKMAYDLLAALGVRAPAAKFVRLRVNGAYQGVYVDLEQVDKHFLDAHGFADPDASIYRCGWKDCEMKTWQVPYQGDWQKKTNALEDWSDLNAFLGAVNHTPEPELVRALERTMTLDDLLASMTMDALMSNDYVEDSESYLVHDRALDRWSYVPWDLNNADARWWHAYPLGSEPVTRHPLFIFSLADAWVERTWSKRQALYPGYLPVFSNLNTRVALNPELRARLLALLEKALAEVFADDEARARVDAMHRLIAPHVAGDPYLDQDKFAAGKKYLQDFVSRRRTFVQSEMARWRARRNSLVISAFDARAGWVEIANLGAAPVDLGGLVLTTNLREALTPNLGPRTLAPGASVRLQGFTFAPAGEIGLFDGRSVVGAIDALFYGPLPAGSWYARAPDQRWTIAR